MSSPAPGLSPTQQADRVAAVILNKVENLTWFYFNVNWDKFELDLTKQIPRLSVLSKVDDRGIADRSSRYKWIGTPEEKDELLSCILFVLRTNPDTGRQLFRRIFDLNTLPESEADKGSLGFFNLWVTYQRQKMYRKNLRKRKERKDLITIVAEGDSWFQFPFPRVKFGWLDVDIVQDIVDHFVADSRYRVLSLAAGGDWISTMLQSGQYVSELSRIHPDFFLFSGGGNDLTAFGRAAFMVRTPKPKPDDPKDQLPETPEDRFLKAAAVDLIAKRLKARTPHHTFDRQRYESGLSYLTSEFFGLMNLLFLEYLLLLQSLSLPKLNDLAIITHGYDYMRPSRKDRCWLLRLPFRWIENWLVAKQWLWVPMEEKKLSDKQKQDAIYSIIYEFNELMISLVHNSGHQHLFHIDCRGMAGIDDWYDEIHLNSKTFGRIKAIMDTCMRSHPLPKSRVFTERDVIKK